MAKTYGYVRVSTVKQSIERQIKNIKAKYPDAIIIQDEYTGTKMDRPEWSKLYKKLKKGDVVVFDSVSRMSRNAEEGFKTYQELYDRGVELIFLKEPHINTETYKKALTNGVELTGTKVDYILKGVNEYLMALAKEQIQIAFDQSEKEVMDIRQRVKEGIAVRKEKNEQAIVKYGDKETAKAHGAYREEGRSSGDRLHIKKAEPIKELIRQYSRDFDGNNTDAEVLAILNTKTIKTTTKKRNGGTEESMLSAHISRNTLYKYKREMKEAEDN